MSATFASPEWADSLAAHLRDDEAFVTDATTWVFGPIAIAIEADGETQTPATVLRIELHGGVVQGVRATTPAEAALAPFELGGSLARWRSIFSGELTMVDAVLQSKLRARGDLPTLGRHRSLLDGVARSAAALDTAWPEAPVEA